MQRPIRFPPVRPAYYPMRGGLDLVTPAIQIDPGKVFDSQNYEPLTVGGYKRLAGHERLDGRPAPSAASYWLISATITGALAVGNTVTGGTSAATGKVLAIDGTTIVLGRVSGTFASGEALNVGGTPRATTTSLATENAASAPATHVVYRLLAANDRRADIQAVPGSGPVRGVYIYQDTYYAFRDNAGGTAGDLYKSTAGGWVQVTFGRELQFTGATAEISAGQTVTGATSGASAVVVRALLRTGTWGASGVGTLVFASVTGAFVNAENIQVGGVTKAVASGADSAITRAPGGRLDIITANFTGSTATERMYGADGVNKAFEFDGTTYVPIRTGMTTDTPSHIAWHLNRLWLSFQASVQFSSVAQPYGWTAVTGAGEIATGEIVTGMVSQSGNAQGASLSITTSERLFILYGSSSSAFQLVPSNDDLGFQEFTQQTVSNGTYGVTARGIQSLVTTLNYGDFNFSALSFLVQPLLEAKREAGLSACAATLKARNQYRLFWSDNTGLIVGLTGEKINGIMPVDYGRPVLCICTKTLTNGREVTIFGSDDGYVFMDNVGTSFDGDTLPAWIRPVFNNLQTPLVRKQYRRAVFEVKTDGYSLVNISYDLGYATPNVAPAAPQADTALLGTGGYWDQFVWNRFIWSAAVITEASISMNGTEKNVSFFFYSNRAEDDPHVVQGVNLLYTPRRLQRSGS